MTFRSYLAGIVGVLLVTGCDSSRKNASGKSQDNIPVQPPVTLTHHTTAGVTINGDLSDWHVPEALTDHSTGISLSLQTDTANLYIAMHVINQATQMKLLRMGMQLYLDTGEQKSQAVFVAYPVRDELQYTQNQNNGNLQGVNRSEKQQLMARAIMLQTRGLKDFRDGMHLKKNADGPIIALGEDGNNNLIYEASIPLKQIFGSDFHYTNGEIPLNIGCKINGFDKSNDKNKKDGAQGFDVTGGQQGFGGGRMGGYRNNRTDVYGDMLNIHKDVVFWIKAFLH